MRLPNSVFHLIVNPYSGRGRVAAMLPSIESFLRDNELKHVTTVTTGRGHANAIAEQALKSPQQTVVAVGGDGTLNEVANAVVAADPALQPTLGLIACGTGNDFARCVGISGTIEEMCAIVANGERRSVDVGSVTGAGLPLTYFLAAAGVGYIADTAATVNRGVKFLRGMPAYLFGAVQTLAKFKPVEIRLRIDGGPVRSVVATLISVSNIQTTGGGMRIAPGAASDDGKLTVCLVHAIGKLELLRQLPNVIEGRHVDHPAVEMIQATEVEIAAENPLSLWIDGEVEGATPAKFSILPKRLPILLPVKP